MHRSSRAQASVENLLILLFALILLASASYLAYVQYEKLTSEFALYQSKQDIVKIIENADRVWGMGCPSKLRIDIFIPPRVNGITIDGNEVIFKVDTISGINSIVGSTNTEISGDISMCKNFGICTITIAAEEDYVLIAQNDVNINCTGRATRCSGTGCANVELYIEPNDHCSYPIAFAPGETIHAKLRVKNNCPWSIIIDPDITHSESGSAKITPLESAPDFATLEPNGTYTFVWKYKSESSGGDIRFHATATITNDGNTTNMGLCSTKTAPICDVSCSDC
ncbi:MAG: hypothetical protein QXP42_03525 [Candidatus Micrarchaeia archaeon]